MHSRTLLPLALLLATLGGHAVAGEAIEGTFAMTTEAQGVRIRSTTVELAPHYIREGNSRLSVAEWERKDGYLTARDPRGAILLHARIEDGGDTLVQEIDGVGTATFTRTR